MALITIILGLALIVLGVSISWITNNIGTALIPAYFGGVFMILGLLGQKDNLRKHVMHAAAGLGLVGFLGAGVMLVLALRPLFGGEKIGRPAAAFSQGVMALLCAVFVGLCIRSFVNARRARARDDPGTPYAV